MANSSVSAQISQQSEPASGQLKRNCDLVLTDVRRNRWRRIANLWHLKLNTQRARCRVELFVKAAKRHRCTDLAVHTQGAGKLQAVISAQAKALSQVAGTGDEGAIDDKLAVAAPFLVQFLQGLCRLRGIHLPCALLERQRCAHFDPGYLADSHQAGGLKGGLHAGAVLFLHKKLHQG